MNFILNLFLTKGCEFLANNVPVTEHSKMAVAVDVLIFTVSDGHVEVLLEKRADEPYKDYPAVPGSFIRDAESPDEAVKRCLHEEIGVDDIYFEQLYTWGDISRDPRTRVISISYIALVNKSRCHPVAGERVKDIFWQTVDTDSLGELEKTLAYDHGKMISYALQRLKGKLEYTSIVFHMMEEEFTLPDLQAIYEILLGKPLYKANFRRKINEFVEDTGKFETGNPHRPSKLYRWNGK